MESEKKYVKSPIVIICYVLAAAMLAHAIYTGATTVKQINEYYASYGMSATSGEYFTYVLQAVLEPFLHAFTLFMAGYILHAVRKLDPNNYKTVTREAEAAVISDAAETEEIPQDAERAEDAEDRENKEGTGDIPEE